MTNALELRGVSAGYGSMVVLRDVDLAVSMGEVAAMVGPNGAGKTTLMRVAGGLISPRAGSVLAGDTDATAHSPARRAKLGVCLVPEGRGVFPSLTVRENLRLQVPPWIDSNDIAPALDVFPALTDHLDRRAGSLSGGQQQMVALSRCILARPKIVLLDEVSMGLAPRVVEEIFEALHGLARTGVAVLLVEQYVGRALEMADTVHLLQRGRLVHSGPATDIDQAAIEAQYFGVHDN